MRVFPGSESGAPGSGAYSLDLPPLSSAIPQALGPELGGSPRREKRSTVDTCRAIALQLLGADGQACSGWHAVDIIDISLGGMCLLIAADHQIPLAELMALRLDVRSQPAFGVDVINAQLRWIKRSAFVHTLGIVFDQPLQGLPALV